MIAPLGRLGAGQHGQAGLTDAVQFGPAAILLLLVPQRYGQAVLGQAPAHALTGLDADIQRLRNLLIRPGLVGLEQDTGASQFARLGLASFSAWFRARRVQVG